VASVFELQLDDVPDFCHEEPRDEWYLRYAAWLADRGMCVVTINCDEKLPRERMFRDSYLIVSGENADGVRHAVIYFNGEPVHNPNRNCEGITPDQVDIIFPQEVARCFI
jgi:hypothetical protein